MEDFYRKSFSDGGVTYQQLLFLLDRYKGAEYATMKFKASLAGIDLDNLDDQDAPSTRTKNSHTQSRPSSFNTTMFRDPADYADMPEEEREMLTQKMTGHFKNWAGNSDLKAS